VIVEVDLLELFGSHICRLLMCLYVGAGVVGDHSVVFICVSKKGKNSKM